MAIGDDVIRSQSTAGGRRRGAAGIVLICKIAGALAAGGHGLTKIFAVCQRLSMDRMATVNAVISLRKRTYREDASSEYVYIYIYAYDYTITADHKSEFLQHRIV